MGLFVRCYNRYLNRNRLKNPDKGLINFRNTHPKERTQEKADDITFYECGKSCHYRTTCPSLQRNPTRCKENNPKLLEPILCGKKRVRALTQILAQAPMMNVSTCS